MTKQEAVDLTRRAFESGEVSEFLCGKKEYAIPISRFVSANVPTDLEYIIRIGLYGYFLEASSADSSITEHYIAAIKRLLEGDCVSVWCAYMVCLFQIRYEIRQRAPFKIMSEDMVKVVSHALWQNKDALESSHLWQGEGRERGLWQDIETTNQVLQKGYGVSFL